jgi:hypothetical protein
MKPVNPEGQVYDPEAIETLKKALDDAWSQLNAKQRERIPRTLLAQRILKAAAKGERDPRRLRASALIRIVPRMPGTAA